MTPSGQTTATNNPSNSASYVDPLAHASYGPSRIDMGVDFTYSGGPSAIGAIGKAKVIGQSSSWASDNPGPIIVYQLLDGPLQGQYVYIAEDIGSLASTGSVLEAGQTVCHFTPGSIEMGWSSSTVKETLAAATCGYSGGECTAPGRDFAALLNHLGSKSVGGCTGPKLGDLKDPKQAPFLNGGGVTVGPPNSGGTAGGVGDIEAIGKAAALSTFLSFGEAIDMSESLALKGERSLMNDQPLFPFIQQICQASLRSFQSMPNGTFFAFYPDYFGGLNHRTPYWRIEDIEILDGTIQLSDDALATHVFIVGDTATFDGVIDTFTEKTTTQGVVTVITAFMANFINGVSSPALTFDNQGNLTKKQQQAITDYEKAAAKQPDLSSKEHAITFLQKYGARPYYEEAPMIRSHFFEMFLAFQRFCLLWSEQFLTTFTTTFMPEVFPGGIISFPDHGIQCFVNEVSHECHYETGFVTRMNLIAPAATKDGRARITDPSAGMVRAGIFTDPSPNKSSGADNHGK